MNLGKERPIAGGHGWIPDLGLGLRIVGEMSTIKGRWEVEIGTVGNCLE